MKGGRSSQLLLSLLFLGIRIAFPDTLHPTPPPRAPQEGTAIVPRVHGRNPSQCSACAAEGEAAAPGTRSGCKGSRSRSVKCHQRQPRPHHFGRNRIDRPSLTGYSKQEREKKDEPGTRGRGTRGRRDAAPANSGSSGGRAGPPPSGDRGQRGQLWKDRPPRCPPPEHRPCLRTPIQPEPVSQPPPACPPPRG